MENVQSKLTKEKIFKLQGKVQKKLNEANKLFDDFAAKNDLSTNQEEYLWDIVWNFKVGDKINKYYWKNILGEIDLSEDNPWDYV